MIVCVNALATFQKAIVDKNLLLKMLQTFTFQIPWIALHVKSVINFKIGRQEQISASKALLGSKIIWVSSFR